nr:prolyl 4-hydroxylase subunit alpha-1-like isoform X2 [Drosophila kikkawai]
MNTLLLLFMILFSLSSILGQGFENDTRKRLSWSVANMDELLKLEEELALNLEHYTNELIKKYNTISWGISMMDVRHVFQSEMGPKKFWENPLNSYSLIRHMESDWHMWQLYMEKPVGLEQLAFLESKKPTMPQYHDFYDAAEGLRRTQWTYDLLAQDISQGLLDGVQYNSSLTALDCFDLVQHLINGSRWSIAMQWIEATKLALDRSDPQPAIQMLRGITPALLYKTLAKAQVEQEVDKALKAYQLALIYSPKDAELRQEFFDLELKSLIMPGNHSVKPEQKDDGEDIKLPFCCSGQCDLPSKLQLYCWWNTQSHPFLRLAPIKTEFLSLDPHVVLLHDVVSAAERTRFQTTSKKDLLPSGTVDIETDTLLNEQDRTSMSLWYDEHPNDTKRLNVLLQDATGLDMEYSESYQVMNYGIGGLFETHMDSLLKNEDRYRGIPDRLATVLFYLSEVPQGGATVFPELNLTVFPQPGSALFWYNTDKKGYQNTQTLHAGCPVIVGSKWVMSKWIDDLGQELRAPCKVSD